MEATFISTHTWNPERIRALAIYCSDGRWGRAFDEFCHESLLIPRYDRFAVPGGPLWLVVRDISLTIPHSAARDQLQFLVKVHQTRPDRAIRSRRVRLLYPSSGTFSGHLPCSAA